MGRLSSECVVGVMVVVFDLPSLEFGVEQSGLVDGDTPDDPVRLFGINAVAVFDIPFRRNVRGSMYEWLMPSSRTCP